MARTMFLTTNLFANSPISDQLTDLGNILLRSLHYKHELGFDGASFRYDSINDGHPINYQHLDGFKLAVENGGLGPVINDNPNMETLIRFCNTVLVEIGYKKMIHLENGLFSCIDLIPANLNDPTFINNFEGFKLMIAFQEVLCQFQPTPLHPMTRADLQTLIFDLLRWYGMDTEVYEGFLTVSVVYRFMNSINGLPLPGFPGLQPQAVIEYDAVNDTIFFN
ncbi:hypothetical protein CASFOL_013773 [Castilleja foliolosa]|uniref:Uncharacterized protein n=1 Tax=Castilleja foliolosa TaxID=1961234 RepID=A0ABD3DKY7_9LAMI